MQSKDYVPGVSGWKIHKDGRLEISGYVRADTSQPEADSAKPFIVVDDVIYISAAEVKRAAVTRAELTPTWSVKMAVKEEGEYFASGIGLGLSLGGVVTYLDKLAVKKEQPKSETEQAIADRNAAQILDMLVGQISETELGKSLAAERDPFAERVLVVLRDELRPGGLLHRFNR